MSRKELTPYQRGEIAGARKIGGSWTTIKDTFKVAIRSARNTVAMAGRRDNGASQRRQGRPNLTRTVMSDQFYVLFAKIRHYLTHRLSDKVAFKSRSVLYNECFENIISKSG